MGKNVYSLVLADDVVQAVDAAAYRMGTSRSNLINQILAEKLNVNTPEMRMRDIFSVIEQLMNSRFQFLDQPSDAMISMKSPLKYKYKPTIKYSVELARDFSGKVGRLKVMFRTTSAALLETIDSFFLLWQKIESKYLSELYTNDVPSECSQGRFVRDFYSPKQEVLSDEDIGNAIGQYIELMDKCIQNYFDNISQPQAACSSVEKIYRNYLSDGVLIL